MIWPKAYKKTPGALSGPRGFSHENKKPILTDQHHISFVKFFVVV